MAAYTVTAPNGEKLTRNSKRVYTHAVVVRYIESEVNGWRNGTEYGASFHSTEESARKMAAKDAKLVGDPNGYREVHVIAVDA